MAALDKAKELFQGEANIKPANIIRRDSDGKYVLIDFVASKEFRNEFTHRQ